MQPDALATGSLALDLASGVGGWPRGHLVELYGDESTGKTTLALLACRAAQLAGGAAAFIDVDRTLRPSYARALGLDPERLLVAAPERGEDACGVARALLRTGTVTVVVIDSVAALLPDSERSTKTSDGPRGAQHKLVRRAVQELFNAAARKRALVICVNRIVHKPGRDGGWVETSAGGSMLPSLASVRVRLRMIDSSAMATRIRAVFEKNAITTAGRPVADVLIRWGAGVDYSSDLLCAAFEAGIVTARGGRFSFEGCVLGGFDEARAAMLGEVGSRVRSAVRTAIDMAVQSHPFTQR